MHAVSVGATGVTERLSLVCLEPLHLVDAKCLLASAGFADRFHALLDAARPLIGRRLVVPAGGAVLGFRPQPDGLEFKLELLVARWRVDALRAFAGILAARPASSGAFSRWRRALAGSAHPGRVNVVSVRLGPGYGPEMSVYIRPLELARICGIRDGFTAVNTRRRSERAGEGDTVTKKATRKSAPKKPTRLKTLPPRTVGARRAKAVTGGAEVASPGPWGVGAHTVTGRSLSASTLKISADSSVAGS
jgi:hypothetical protein